jgi:ribosomal protein S18 acetylase RimI-like enzyme
MISEDAVLSRDPVEEPGKTGSGIVVRRAVDREADEVHRLVSESMETYRALSGITEGLLESSSETVADTRVAMHEGVVLVAADASMQIVGTVRLMTRRGKFFPDSAFFDRNGLSEDTPVLYFTRFAVRQEARSKGIGSLLIAEGEKIAESKGIPAIFLHTALNNESAVSYYKSRGFEIDSVDLSRGYPRGLFFKKV